MSITKAEAQRAANETERQEAENTRIQKESERQTAEQERIVNNEACVTAINTALTAAEEATTAANTAMQVAATAEATIAKSEKAASDAAAQANATNESIKTNEQGRVDAEMNRESAELTRNKQVADAISNINKAQANNIKKIEQTTTSIESGGINIITITTGNGTTSFEVRNGSKGDQGEKGEKGEQGTQGIQGVKGDPFTYDDFTPDEIVNLKKPATDAANELNKYLDIVKLPVVETPASGTTVAMDANKVYDITIGESLTITLNTPTDLTVTNEYQGSFDTGSTAPTVTFPANVIWTETPSVEANKHYEFNIRYIGGKYYGLVQAWNINTEEESV